MVNTTFNKYICMISKKWSKLEEVLMTNVWVLVFFIKGYYIWFINHL